MLAVLYHLVSSPYTNLAVLILGIAFFRHAAREENRSEVVYALMSIGAWITVTQWILPGAPGGLLSQFLLFAGLTVYDVLRERRAA